MTYATMCAGESMYYVVVCMRLDMYALRRMFVGARMFACTTEQIDWILHAFAGWAGSVERVLTPRPQNQMNLHIRLQSRLGWFS